MEMESGRERHAQTDTSVCPSDAKVNLCCLLGNFGRTARNGEPLKRYPAWRALAASVHCHAAEPFYAKNRTPFMTLNYVIRY